MPNGIDLKIEINGTQEMASKFSQSQDVVQKYLNDALSILASQFVGAAKGYAPVKTSSLRESIHKEGPFNSRLELSYEVGTNIFYAPFQEFGTRYIAARQFFKKARDDVRAKAPDQLRTALGDIVSELSR